MTSRAIISYVLLALAASWGMQIPAIALLGIDHPTTRVIFVAVMWSPTLLAVLFLVFRPESRLAVFWRLGKLIYLPLGMAVETAIGFAVVAAAIASGLASSGWFTFSPAGVSVGGGPWLLGHGFQSWPLYLVDVVATGAAYSIISLVATTGEEFAWRGFLQGQLIPRVGTVKAILLVAATWWAWHLPGLLAGYDFPQYPLIGALVLFPLQMAGASFFLGWLTLRARSFWPAALAHGAVNSIQQGVVGNLQVDGSRLAVDALLTGLVVLSGIPCLISLVRHERRTGRLDPGPKEQPLHRTGPATCAAPRDSR